MNTLTSPETSLRQRLRSSLGETTLGSRGTVWLAGFASSWTKWNKIEIRMTDSMSPREKAMQAAKTVAFRVAIAARSFDIGHSLPFGLDRNGGGRLIECLGRNAGLRCC
jgi:hypothetical protein